MQRASGICLRASRLWGIAASSPPLSCRHRYGIPTTPTFLLLPAATTTLLLRSSTQIRHYAAAGAASPEVPVGGTTAPAPKSKNRQFKEIPVHPRILAHIREICVGIAPRDKKARKMDRITKDVIIRKDRKSRGGATTAAKTQQQSTAGRQRGTASQQQVPIATTTAISNTAEESRPPGAPPLNPYAPPRPFGKQAFKVRIAAKVNDPENPMIPELLDGVPQEKVPQVAICGRSNVGKSSLLNVLLYSDLSEIHRLERKRDHRVRDRVRTFKLLKGVKAIASPTPGETRHITFYQLGAPNPHRSKEDIRMMLVDLPGYGFAYTSPEEHANFQQLMAKYLTGTLPGQNKKALKRILFLIDSRHGMKVADLNFLEMIQTLLVKQDNEQEEAAAAAAEALSKSKRRTKSTASTSTTTTNRKKTYMELPPIQIVLTKCDLVHQMDLARRVVQVQQQLSDALYREPAQLPVMLVSSRTNNGILELQKQIATLAASVSPVRPTKQAKPPPEPLASLNLKIPDPSDVNRRKQLERNKLQRGKKKRWPVDPETGKKVIPEENIVRRERRIQKYLKKQMSASRAETDKDDDDGDKKTKRRPTKRTSSLSSNRKRTSVAGRRTAAEKKSRAVRTREH